MTVITDSTAVLGKKTWDTGWPGWLIGSTAARDCSEINGMTVAKSTFVSAERK
jgi:hypothetical protein